MDDMTKVLTHWDADGIVSGSKALQVLEAPVYVPRIGSWSFEAVPKEALGDVLYVLDYSMPYEDWAKLCSSVKDLIVIDHHAAPRPPCGKVTNPALEGRAPPSASVVVSDYFNLPYDWRDAVAIAGDLHDPRGDPLWEAIVKKEGIRGEETIEAAALLNSCYKLLDYNCIIEYTKKLRYMTLRELLNDERLLKKREEVRRVLEELVSSAECVKKDDRKVCVVKDDRGIIMISSLWKRLKDEGETVVVALGRERARVYCRGGEYDYTSLIKMLRGLGVKEVGGKKVVCSANLDRHELPKVLKALGIEISF